MFFVWLLFWGRSMFSELILSRDKRNQINCKTSEKHVKKRTWKQKCRGKKRKKWTFRVLTFLNQNKIKNGKKRRKTRGKKTRTDRRAHSNLLVFSRLCSCFFSFHSLFYFGWHRLKPETSTFLRFFNRHFYVKVSFSKF